MKHWTPTGQPRHLRRRRHFIKPTPSAATARGCCGAPRAGSNRRTPPRRKGETALPVILNSYFVRIAAPSVLISYPFPYGSNYNRHAFLPLLMVVCGAFYQRHTKKHDYNHVIGENGCGLGRVLSVMLVSCLASST